MAQLGSALRSGRRGRRFKSCYPDQLDWVNNQQLLCLQVVDLFAVPGTLSPVVYFLVCPEVDPHTQIGRVDRRRLEVYG